MIPANYNLTLYQGDEFEMVVRMRLAQAKVEDLTGLVGIAQIRATYDAPVMASFTVTIMNQSTDKGKIRLFLPSSESASLVPGHAVYDLSLAQNDGAHRKTRLSGKVIIKPRVSR